jgi:hypothetical protein
VARDNSAYGAGWGIDGGITTLKYDATTGFLDKKKRGRDS